MKFVCKTGDFHYVELDTNKSQNLGKYDASQHNYLFHEDCPEVVTLYKTESNTYFAVYPKETNWSFRREYRARVLNNFDLRDFLNGRCVDKIDSFENIFRNCLERD